MWVTEVAGPLARIAGWVLTPFAWRFVRAEGVWAYFENGVSGARRAVRASDAGCSPADLDWLARQSPVPKTPPQGGSSVWR